MDNYFFNTEYLLTERLSLKMIISLIVGALSSILGYYSAVVLDASIAVCMIAAAGLTFAVVFLLSPTHGIVFINTIIENCRMLMC